MGVKVREKDKDSGVYWVFINYKGKRTSRQIGTFKAANRVKEQIEARLKLGQDALPEQQKPVPTLQAYYDDVFKPVYIESAVASSTANNYKTNFKNHILPAFGSLRLNGVTDEKVEEFVSNLVKMHLAKATIQTIIKELS